MEMDPSLRGGSQATVSMVSATSPQFLIAKASPSQKNNMRTLIQTIRQGYQKNLPQTIQNFSNSRSSSTDGLSVRFNNPNQIDKVQIQNKIKATGTQTTITTDTIPIKTIDVTTVAISTTTDTIIIPIHQISNKTGTTQTNNPVGIATEQITSPGIVKPVLTAEDRDICLVNVEHHNKIRTRGNKIRLLTKTRKITIKTATQIPHNNKVL